MATLETHDFQKRVKHSQRKDLSKVEAAASQGNSGTVTTAAKCHAGCLSHGRAGYWGKC